MSSIADLQNCEAMHLKNFCDPSGTRSFSTYDRRGNPLSFEPTDALAPGLLDAPLRRVEVNQMLSNVLDNPYRELRLAIDKCLSELALFITSENDFLDFADAELDGTRGPWAFVHSCFAASDKTPNIKASKVSKILHRKLPTFVPIIDSKLVGFYGLSMREPKKYWSTLQFDYRVNREFLDTLGKNTYTSEGYVISSLRVADIIIWEHVTTGCKM
jgi:hypothetical protein